MHSNNVLPLLFSLTYLTIILKLIYTHLFYVLIHLDVCKVSPVVENMASANTLHKQDSWKAKQVKASGCKTLLMNK